MSDGSPDTRSRHPWSLRTYMLGLTGLFVAALVGGSIYSWFHAQDSARATVVQDTTYAAQTAATSVATDLKGLQAGVAQTAATPGVAQLFDPRATCSLSFGGVGSFITGHLDIVRADGSVACSSSDAVRGISYAAAPWFAGAQRAAALVAPYADPATGEQVAVSTAPVPGGGFVVGIIDLTPAATGLSATLGGPNHFEFLLTTGDGGTALTRSIQPALWSGKSLQGTAFARDAGGTEFADVNGTTRLWGTATVPGVGWRVYSGEVSTVALAAAKDLARQNAAIFGGAAAVLIVAILVIYRRIARPILRLDTAVRAARPGAGFAPIDVGGPREVAALACSFTRLMGEVDGELTQRREAEARLSTSLADLEIADSQRRRLLDKLVNAQEEERRRIASDVHDDSVQLIAASIMRVSLIRQQDLAPGTAEQLAKLQSSLEGSVERLRNLLFQLRPPSLDRAGLSAALTEYFAQWAPEANIAYRIDNRLRTEPDSNTRVALFRIAQEALTNVRKHSRARTVTVTLDAESSGVRLQIEDDGVGISNADADGSPIGHLGLVTMRERAELAGGWCRVHGVPSHGTVVEVWLPLVQRGDEVAVATAAVA
jgi:signal transduction histidine kinase